jgi:uncharacterized protein (TIGR02391 family)
MAEWTLSADEIVALPLDELAMRVLRHILETEAWSGHNWMLDRKRALGRRDDAIQALEEACAWLRSKPLLAGSPGEMSETNLFVTRQGRQTLDRGLNATRAEERLNLELHPRIARSVRSQFLLGEYELATIASFREVEIYVRELGNYSADDHGVDMLRRAFGPNGPLTDPGVPRGEQDAVRELFTGAYGAFRNPASHRIVDTSDVTMASEVVLLADLLLRTLDRVRERL